AGPLRPRPRVQRRRVVRVGDPGGFQREDDRRRGDPGPAVGTDRLSVLDAERPELRCEVRRGQPVAVRADVSREGRVDGAGDVAGAWVDGFDVAAVALGGSRVEEGAVVGELGGAVRVDGGHTAGVDLDVPGFGLGDVRGDGVAFVPPRVVAAV